MLPALGGGSSLRGYSSWRFRDQNALLLQAEWRIMVNRYLDLAFFYDAGKVARAHEGSRSRRDERRLRLRPPVPRPVCHAAPRRAGEEPRKQPLLHFLVGRLFLRYLLMLQSTFSRRSRTPRAAGPVGLRRRVLRHRRVDTGTALLSRRPDRARPGVAGRVEGRAPRSVADVRTAVQPVRDGRPRAERPAREEHQHHRRGAGLELVHEPDRHQADHRRGARCADRTSARRPTRRSGC